MNVSVFSSMVLTGLALTALFAKDGETLVILGLWGACVLAADWFWRTREL